MLHLVQAIALCEAGLTRKGDRVRHRKSERFVSWSERMVLECECGERLVLLGREDDWYSERRLVFGCECGRKLTLADRVDEGFVNRPRLRRR